MVDRRQRNGESYASYLLRLRDELKSAVTKMNEHIYKLTCMILDEVPMCKDLEGALPIFIDLKKEYEKELHEVEDDISSLQIVVTDNDIFLDRKVESEHVRHGYWKTRMSTPDSMKCSVCGNSSMICEKVCPHCHAIMDYKENNDERT